MPIPVTLTIAGSDNSAGAGIQADLKTFSAYGTYGLTAITCVVAEIPGKVEAIAPVPPEVVAGQVRLSLEAYPVAAMKTGMLFSEPVIDAVAETLLAQPEGSLPQIVVDPVMIATSGDPLLEPGAIAAYKARIFPLATLVTPNLDEAAALVGRPLATLAAMEAAGRELTAQYGCAFLLKGGHLPEADAIDLLLYPDGRLETFRSERITGVDTHGTGCTFSAAITAGLAKGWTLSKAVEEGKAFVSRAIAGSFRWGAVHGLNHGLIS